MAKYRILSVDGGGIRGILVCVMLERLEEIRPGFLAKFDLYAGTSTGSVLALGLALGATPTTARILYEAMAEQVFAPTWRNRVPILGNALWAKYSNQTLKRVLTEHFGDLTLGGLTKKVLISSFNLDRNPSDPGRVRSWKPKFFNNFQTEDLNERLVDVVMRSGAAPTVFPCYQGYVDGGLVANNPSVAALAQALDPRTSNQALEDVVLLSLGTGRTPEFLSRKDSNWGWLQWARPVLPIIMEGSVDVAHYQASRFLGERYERLNPLLPEPIKADDIRRIEELKRIGSEVTLAPTVQWLERFV